MLRNIVVLIVVISGYLTVQIEASAGESKSARSLCGHACTSYTTCGVANGHADDICELAGCAGMRPGCWEDVPNCPGGSMIFCHDDRVE